MRHRAASAALAAAAILALAAPARASRESPSPGDDPPPREHHHHFHFFARHPPDYGPWFGFYDNARAYYGGRGDDRWRWYDGALPGYVGYPVLVW